MTDIHKKMDEFLKNCPEKRRKDIDKVSQYVGPTLDYFEGNIPLIIEFSSLLAYVMGYLLARDGDEEMFQLYKHKMQLTLERIATDAEEGEQ